MEPEPWRFSARFYQFLPANFSKFFSNSVPVPQLILSTTARSLQSQFPGCIGPDEPAHLATHIPLKTLGKDVPAAATV